MFQREVQIGDWACSVDYTWQSLRLRALVMYSIVPFKYVHEAFSCNYVMKYLGPSPPCNQKSVNGLVSFSVFIIPVESSNLYLDLEP